MLGFHPILTKDQHNKQAYPKNFSAWFSFHFKQQIHQTNLITCSKKTTSSLATLDPHNIPPPPTSEGRTWMRSSQSNSRRSSGGFASFWTFGSSSRQLRECRDTLPLCLGRGTSSQKLTTTICMAKIRSWVLLNLLNRALWHRKQFFSEINFVRKQLPLFLSGPQRKINYITYTHIQNTWKSRL